MVDPALTAALRLQDEGQSEPGQDKGLEAATLNPWAEKEGAVRGGLDTGGVSHVSQGEGWRKGS